MKTLQQHMTELAEYIDDPDRCVDASDGWIFGERVRVVEDDEVSGVFAGDEGVLVIEVVGAAEYGNERVCFGIVDPGVRDLIEVSPHNIEPA